MAHTIFAFARSVNVDKKGPSRRDGPSLFLDSDAG